MKSLLSAICLCLSLNMAYAQNQKAFYTIHNFAALQGNWTGVLEYTNYQDDKTKVQLSTLASFALQFDKLMGQYAYTEPDGSTVYSKMQIGITKNGDFVNFDGEKMRILKNTEGVILLEGESEDNNQVATVRQTIRWQGDSLTVLKEVKYKGKTDFMVRHEYRFQRETTAAVESRLLKNLLGKWTLDLRPAPNTEGYLKDFILTSFEDGNLSGAFYGTQFTGGKINTSWGKIYFAFTTADQSGVYFHSGYIENGKIYGNSFSEKRGFMMPWFGVR